MISHASMPAGAFRIRRATVADAAGIARVLEIVASERLYSAIDRAWSEEEQRTYLSSLSAREAFQVAIIPSGEIVGYQSLDLYSVVLPSMSHVGQLGTFVLPPWRGHGIGRALFAATRELADSVGYRKFVIHVRASNVAARRFYAELGFRKCGRLREQVVIDGRPDDEILMELLLPSDPSSSTRQI
jgi:RimJ/RimL family protein N-acetyltransferase